MFALPRPALLALSAALAVAGTSCGETDIAAMRAAIASLSPGPVPSPSARIGDYITAGNWKYSVRQVDTAPSVNRGIFGIKKAKGLFVLVWIELTNVGKENFIINETDFEIWDGAGIKYTWDYASDDVAKARGQTAIGIGEKFPPGVTLATTIVFDVAPGTTGMRLYLVQARQLIRLE